MLRTNSKKAREAVRDFVTKNTNGWEADPKTFEEAAGIIKEAWERYKYPGMRWERKTLQEHFGEFASGLPNNVFDFIAEGDTAKLVGDMLEETEDERKKYSDSEACDLLTYLIFREVDKAVGIDF